MTTGKVLVEGVFKAIAEAAAAGEEILAWIRQVQGEGDTGT